MADQWKAVDVWQHMYAAVEDQNGVEVARVYRPDRLLIAEQIAQAYNAQAERAALIEENERLREALDAIRLNADAFYETQTEMHPGHRNILTMFGDAARNALTPARPGDVGAGAPEGRLERPPS